MISNLAKAFSIKLLRDRQSRLRKILWEMGRSSDHFSSLFVDRFSRFNHQAKWGAASWKSLDLFYNYYGSIKPVLQGDLEGRLTRYWIEKMENRQAVTNRLKIVVSRLVGAFLKFANESEIRILSMASGSAQAVVMAISQCPQVNIRAVLVDLDSTAIAEAEKIVKEFGLEDRFSFVGGTTAKLEEVCASFHPHIIEMVGFLDYRPSHKAIQLIGRIYNCLPSGGILITCNIRKNREKIFLDWVLLWPLIYRDEKELANLLVKGGFSSRKVTLVYEPFRIHGIAICSK